MDLGTVFDFGFHFLLVLAMLPVGIGVVWLTRFFRTGQHSLRRVVLVRRILGRYFGDLWCRLAVAGIEAITAPSLGAA